MANMANLLVCSTVVAFTSFIGVTYGFGIYLFPAIAPLMMQEIGLNFADMGWITGMSQVGFLCSALASGLATAKFGAATIMRLSLICCAVSLGGVVFANSYTLVIILMTSLGAAAASIWVPMAEMSQELIPQKHRGKSIGLMSSGTAYGVTFNSLMITSILPQFGWRSLWITAFGVTATLAAISFLLFWRLGRQAIHPIESHSASRQFIESETIKEVVLSLPVRATAIVLVMMLLNGFSCLTFQTYLSSFLVTERELSIDDAGWAWRLIGIVGMVSGFAMGWLADRIGFRWTLRLNFTALLLSATMLTWVSLSSLSLFVLSVSFGVAFYAVFGLVPAYISRNFQGAKTTVVFAFGNICLGLGGILGAMAGGWLKYVTGTFDWIYLAIIVATALSFGLCSLLEDKDFS